MNYEKFKPLLGTWGPYLKPMIESPEMDGIYAKLKEEAARGVKILPKSTNTYRAFAETPYNNLQVVFLLQDPYPSMINNVPVADGIAISCSNTGKLQPSLEQFYDAIEDDLYEGLDVKNGRNPDLSYLCNQGVMMLNTSLTVEYEKPGSHFNIWKPFTTYLFEEIFMHYNRGLVFVLCGEKSHQYEQYINPFQHWIIKVEHPAHAARKMRLWDHQNLFKKVNKVLLDNNNTTINWMGGDLF